MHSQKQPLRSKFLLCCEAVGELNRIMKNSLTTWDPFQEFGDLQNRLSSLFSTRGGSLAETAAKADWAPACDISEDETSYAITADLPDIDKKDVKVSVDDGVLTISGERKHESEEEDNEKRFHRIERSYGKYVRSFRLPPEVDEDAVVAKFENGVLKITLPKTAEPKVESKEVEIH